MVVLGQWNEQAKIDSEESHLGQVGGRSRSLLGDEASKVALARNYAFLTREVKETVPKPEDLL
jgi:hypothetical protein